jgi:AGCS family alanine or glycine:cation symporter
MEEIKRIVEAGSALLWNTPSVMPFMVVLLLFTGIFLTIRLGFVQIRRFGHSIKAILGRYDNPLDPGDVPHYQALTSALSATVGVGNIAGVATAVHYGGPGSVFWLWLTGFIGMATKFTECTLALKYRDVHPDGSVSGGPMYYMEKRLGRAFKWVAIVFAFCAATSALATGNAIQAFTMADSLRADFGIPPWFSGLFSATVVGLVILGGIRRIGRVTSLLVPFMGALYVGSALVLIVLHIDRLPQAIYEICYYAFSPPGMVGGFCGSTFVLTLTWGVKRGLFSNEAGQGSAPIAHAAAKTYEPVREGAVALMEPFVDTVVICFITGLVVVITGAWHEKFEDSVNFAGRSAITAVKEGTTLQTGGKIPSDAIYNGRIEVKQGVPVGAWFVRNHSIVEDVKILADSRHFDGTIEVKSGTDFRFFDKANKEISSEKVILQGKSLLNGSPLTSKAFEIGLGSRLFSYVVSISVFLFAISTAISWSYYGDRAMRYLFGASTVVPYRVLYLLVHFLGAIFSLEVVWGFGDIALGLMALPNIISLWFLSGEVKRDAKDYFARMDALEREAR